MRHYPIPLELGSITHAALAGRSFSNEDGLAKESTAIFTLFYFQAVFPNELIKSVGLIKLHPLHLAFLLHSQDSSYMEQTSSG